MGISSVVASLDAEAPINVISTAGCACGTAWKPPRTVWPSAAMPAPSQASTPPCCRLAGEVAASGAASSTAAGGAAMALPRCKVPGAADSPIWSMAGFQSGTTALPRFTASWCRVRACFCSGVSLTLGAASWSASLTSTGLNSAPPTPLSTASCCQCPGRSAMNFPIPCSWPEGLGNRCRSCHSSAATANAESRCPPPRLGRDCASACATLSCRVHRPLRIDSGSDCTSASKSAWVRSAGSAAANDGNTVATQLQVPVNTLRASWPAVSALLAQPGSSAIKVVHAARVSTLSSAWMPRSRSTATSYPRAASACSMRSITASRSCGVVALARYFSSVRTSARLSGAPVARIASRTAASRGLSAGVGAVLRLARGAGALQTRSGVIASSCAALASAKAVYRLKVGKSAAAFGNLGIERYFRAKRGRAGAEGARHVVAAGTSGAG